MSTAIFYSTLVGAFPIAGVLEKHAAGMLVRSLREGAPIRALLNHDDEQVLGTTADGSLRLTLERDGVRAELDAPATASGVRLAKAMADGSVTGCSFSFSPRRVRWYLDGPRPVREIIDADVSEVSLVLAPKRPASSATWAAALGPRLRARYERLRARPGAQYRPLEVAPANVVLRLEPLALTPLTKLLIPKPPAHLGLVARQTWEQLVPDLDECGMLARIDLLALAECCAVWERIVAAETALTTEGLHLMKKGPKGKEYPVLHPAFREVNTLLPQLKMLLVELGMTPASRTRIKVDKATPLSKLEAFKAKHGD